MQGCVHDTQNRIGRSVILLLVLTVLGVAGCSDGRPKRVPVAGSVTIDGSPLRHGSIQFIPDKGRLSGGSLDDEGHFALTCYELEDGVIPGKYRVKVSGLEFIGESAQKWHAPKKYANEITSGIEYEINERTDSIHIELTWGGGKPFIERW